MCANPQSNWSNTISVRASYILPILKRFPWWKPRKTGGWSISPRKKPKQKSVCLLEFWGRPFKLAKFHWNWWDSMQHDCPGALVDTLLSSCSHHYSVVHWSRLSSLPLPSPHTQKILIIIANCGCPCEVFLYIATTKIISGSNFFKLVLFCFPMFWIVMIKKHPNWKFLNHRKNLLLSHNIHSRYAHFNLHLVSFSCFALDFRYLPICLVMNSQD